jgi:hypothetical protein
MRWPRWQITVRTAVVLVAIAAVAIAMEKRRWELGQARLDATARTYQIRSQLFDSGEIVMTEVYLWSVKLMEAERDLCYTPFGRRAAYVGHLERMKGLQADTNKLLLKGERPLWALLEVDTYVAEAEFWTRSWR